MGLRWVKIPYGLFNDLSQTCLGEVTERLTPLSDLSQTCLGEVTERLTPLSDLPQTCLGEVMERLTPLSDLSQTSLGEEMERLTPLSDLSRRGDASLGEVTAHSCPLLERDRLALSTLYKGCFHSFKINSRKRTNNTPLCHIATKCCNKWRNSLLA